MILLEGLKLMIIGMTTVLLFLSFMILLINIVAKLTAGFAAHELAMIQKEKEERARKAKKLKGASKNEVPTAVFAAAIAAYEKDRS